MTKVKNKREVIPRETVIIKLKEVIADLRNSMPIEQAYLFGSYAHGKPKPYSDVDVAIISPKLGNNIINETVYLMEAFEGTGLMVEPRVYSYDEYKQATKGTFLYNEIIQKGISLV